MSGGAGSGRTALPDRFGDHVREEGLLEPGNHVLVAISGGLDSVVLLHLLQFHPPVQGLAVTAAHLDHGMRRGSGSDALWVRGLATAWDVPVAMGMADPVPSTESQAREVRYAFLRRTATELGVDRVATGHHADDQAETVLFRIARGTGVTGLRGIRPRGADGLVRPLLPFWREEIEAYARRTKLTWRADPTNSDPRYARNAIRHEVLPLLEARVAGGAREALVRLARLAAREEGGWQSILPGLLSELVEGTDEGRFVVARQAFLAYHSAVAARVLRHLARRLGVILDEAGTRMALRFAAGAASGRELHLAGGVRLRRDFDRLVLEKYEEGSGPTGERSPGLVIPGAEPGGGRLELGRRNFVVRWGSSVGERGATGGFPARGLAFPLLLRPWRPGDRIRLAYGSKKLKKLFREKRIPVEERRLTVVLADARGEILWIPGLARATGIPEGPMDLSITLVPDEDDGTDGRSG